MSRRRTSLAMRSGNEFVRIWAPQKKRRTLNRHDFENHFEHSRLKFLGRANTADVRTDFQQRRQIARQAATRRKRFGDLVRLKINGTFLGELHGDGGGELVLKHVAHAFVEDFIVVLDEKNELRPADLDAVAMFQNLFARGRTIDESSVEAFEILKLKA